MLPSVDHPAASAADRPSHPSRWGRPARRVIALATGLGLAGVATAASSQAETTPVPPAVVNLFHPGCEATLDPGEVNGCVTRLQFLLNERWIKPNKWTPIPVTGLYGTATKNVVAAYQRSRGVRVTGSADAAVKDPLESTYVRTRMLSAAFKGYDGRYRMGTSALGMWTGIGPIPYTYGGGHTAAPGPSSSRYASTVGLDCSGFSRWVWALGYGYDRLGTTGSGGQLAKLTAYTNPIPGDLVFYKTSTGTVYHVAVYVGGGMVVDQARSSTTANGTKFRGVKVVSGWTGMYYR